MFYIIQENMDIKIYNSLSNQIETFVPIKENEVSMYVCGPTVYNEIHIGNVRPVVFFDMVARFFKYLGYEVKYVSNFTDIDDKIILAAKQEGVTEKEITDRYKKAFLQINDTLNCEEIYARPEVTNYIDEIIDYIGKLKDLGFAYESDGDVYFRVRKAKNYGMLSNQRLDDLESGARIDIVENKEDPSDFVLWKNTTDGIKWDSPFGKGRPGWHTECCVMINSLLGELIDIHGGGSDLKFPHHENEIAQSMAVTNKPLAKYWVHNARIDLSGEKMSKSLGNVVWAKDILKSYSSNVVRLLILSNHYRQNIIFREELLERATIEFEKIERSYINLYRYLELNDAWEEAKPLPIMEEFLQALGDDFSTPNAFTALFQLVKDINIALRKEEATDTLNQMFKTLEDMLYILGLYVELSPLTVAEKDLIISWQYARKQKDFEKADYLRSKIQEQGIKL